LLFLFFAVTGILLNHDFSGSDREDTFSRRATLPPDVVHAGNRDAVVASLRSSLGVQLPLTRFNSESDNIEAVFSAPGKRVQVLIDRNTREADATFESRGMTGVLADLHKGAQTGPVWRGVMDFTAVYMLVSSLSGTLLMLSIPKHRRSGLLALSGGAIAVLIVYCVWVPR
jgi:hypothetical protein